MSSRDVLDLIWLVPALPLFGAAFLLLFGKRIGEPVAGWIASRVARARVPGVGRHVLRDARPPAGAPPERGQPLHLVAVRRPQGGVRVPRRPALDRVHPASSPASATLIHIYSIGYMHGDPRFSRFFAYMNLFVASMLVLVLGSSFLDDVPRVGGRRPLLLPAGLVLVRAQRRPPNAGKKAFITTRVGDVGFMIAMFLIFAELGSLNYTGANGALARRAPPRLRHRDRDRAAPLPRRGRQERAVPAAPLAARRDGGPDPGLGAHPRRDDGDRRRVPAWRGRTPSSR